MMSVQAWVESQDRATWCRRCVTLGKGAPQSGQTKVEQGRAVAELARGVVPRTLGPWS